MKKVVTALIIAALAIGGWYFYARGDGDAPQYQTAQVVRGDLSQKVTATGTLNAVVNVQVGSQISGNIQKLFADFNSQVKAGEVIAQLDPATYQAFVHQAEGELASAQAALNLARINAQRQEGLAKNRISPQSDLDTAKATLQQADATVTIKSAQLEKAKVDRDRCTIYAPVDGVVISRNVDVGQTVAASLQAPIIFTIAGDLRQMQIDTNVAEADIGNIEVDQSVEFSVDAFFGRVFHGKVAQVRNAPIIVNTVVTYDTVIAVANDDLKLKPGMTTNVSVMVAERQNVVKVPKAALRFRPPEALTVAGTPTPGNASGTGNGRPRGGSGSGGGSGRRERGGPVERTVYTLVDGKPQPVRVKVGIEDITHTEVLEGLKEGDTVITGMVLPQVTPPGQQSGNPLGGQGRRRF
jgi:HlyD family secretion protein